MPNDVSIRDAKATDSEALILLLNELENNQADSSIFNQILAIYLADPMTLLRVLESSTDGIIGFVSCKGQYLLHHQGLVCEIQEMIVTSSQQGKAYGKNLIEDVVQQVQMMGAVSLEVTSNKRRKEAHAFYQAVGFRNSHEKFTIYF
jgi:PhnO protein